MVDHLRASLSLAADGSATYADQRGERVLGRSADVKTDDLVDIDIDFGPDLNARVAKSAGDMAMVNPGLAADLTDILAAGVFCDPVIDVSLRRFSGHVFNLETETGVFVAQGIVTHNCRCDVSAVLPEDMPEAVTDGSDE
jgi:hypothetical protein